ncbi:tRNA lysidine(34) synthetase TilS [Psychrobacter sp. FDAARGOS_221]|uniref:tRNA lysidine(34) synthetase TilS n=1 Tax=Psychrobacter sp. FDAARGOS_221 TaxID=1975705 RepID=UPI000BB5705D|nr:tRNA lysidine(34) synthetase TilS [Psychrobacter sp. FDAARGOS_221]PNK60416.1 tRNA lysidine(34) synthetase TilS [Psychrobacter sp. FDAARGOS_221]
MTPTDALTHALLDSFHQFAESLNGKRVWLACSGGRDSLSLAILCRQLFYSGQLPFLPQLLHVNHGMQEANAAWSQQVMTWAKKQHMHCQVLNLDLEDKSEQGARNARYQAMMQVMNADDVLMLGHHQDDQVETILMRLFSGAGVTGLGGMRPWTSKSHADKQIFLWRPWLAVSRDQITEYAQAQQLDYIDDPTNIVGDSINKPFISESPVNEPLINKPDIHDELDSGPHQQNITYPQTVNDRAWLRSLLLPHITQRYPQAKSAIARTGLLMQDAAVIIDEQTHADLSQVCAGNSAWQSLLDIDKLQLLSSARQSALIHAWLAPTAKDLSPPKRLVDQVLQLASRQNPDHQSCLYWDSAAQQYQIRRYKNHLYRLSQQWVDWLQQPIEQQILPLNAAQSIDQLMLRKGDSVFNWYIQGMTGLSSVLLNQLMHLKPAELSFEPLPRDIKVSLAGRVGRKSGKKLLQAIGQPSFKRASVVLCSLVTESDQVSSSTPLFLVTPEAIILLQSPFLAALTTLVDNQKLVSDIEIRDIDS